MINREVYVNKLNQKMLISISDKLMNKIRPCSYPWAAIDLQLYHKDDTIGLDLVERSEHLPDCYQAYVSVSWQGIGTLKTIYDFTHKIEKCKLIFLRAYANNRLPAGYILDNTELMQLEKEYGAPWIESYLFPVNLDWLICDPFPDRNYNFILGATQNCANIFIDICRQNAIDCSVVNKLQDL